MATATRRKILVPLATLTVAGAVAVGSGASFTSTTASTTAVTSGAVTHVNDTTSLTIGNIKDDDVITGTVTVTNTGSIPSTLTIAELNDSTTFVPGDLRLELLNGTTSLWSGTFGALEATTKLPVGSLPVGGSQTITFKVTLDEKTDNTNEGKSATASFQLVSTQVAGENRSFVTALNDALGVGSGN